MLKVIGAEPQERHGSGGLKVRIATLFPDSVLVTSPPMHALQRLAYVDWINSERARNQLPPLTEDEENVRMERSVDLFQDDEGWLIRPDPSQMELAFDADAMLSLAYPDREVKFQLLSDSRVRDALKRRGECWRIYLPPNDGKHIRRLIVDAKCSIAGQPIYYYSHASGTRYLTYENFASLQSLSDEALQDHLQEIAEYSKRHNRNQRPEIDFFMALKPISQTLLDQAAAARVQDIRKVYDQLLMQFRDAIPDGFVRDDLADPQWRKAMLEHLISDRSGILGDESTIGLDPDFSMRVQWVPGARIIDGELILDTSVSSPAACSGEGNDEASVLRNLIFNLVQEYGDLEYLNVGFVYPSESRDPRRGGRRDVYIAQIKHRRSTVEQIQIIRMQKWGVREKLDEGDSLEGAMCRAEEYAEYVFDRRLACRQLGMNLHVFQSLRKLRETYDGKNAQYRGRTIWTPYFQRDYIAGIATNQIPRRKIARRDYAMRLARLLGQAAAPNLIVGRAENNGESIFDLGDEIIVENTDGLPTELVVSDQVGTFVDWKGPLMKRALDYAKPLRARMEIVPDRVEFVETFLSGFIERFTRIQTEYARHQLAYDCLFRHRPWDPAGSMSCRWESTLKRLRQANAEDLADVIRSAVLSSVSC